MSCLSEPTRENNVRSLIGRRFGRLVVVALARRERKRLRNRWSSNLIWKCQCDCGGTKEAKTGALNIGWVKSCGCALREHVQRMADNNRLPAGVAGFNSVYSNYRDKAKGRGLAFELTKDEFWELTQSDCVYCGSSPQQIYKHAKHASPFRYNGVDRTDNTAGYVRGNVQPCCGFCNQAKSDRTEADFLDWVRAVCLRRGLV